MNILAQAKDLYDKCGIDMNRDIAVYVDDGTNWLRVNLGSAVSATDADEYLIAE